MYNPPSEKTGQFTLSRRQNAAAPACDGVPLGGAGRHRGGPFSPLDKCGHRTSSLRDWPDTGRQVTPQSWASGSGFWTPGPAALEKSGRGRAWPRAHRGEGKAGPGSSALRSVGWHPPPPEAGLSQRALRTLRAHRGLIPAFNRTPGKVWCFLPQDMSV